MAPKNQNTASNDSALQTITEKLDQIIKTLGLQDDRILKIEQTLQNHLSLQTDVDSLKAECRTLKESIQELKLVNRKADLYKNRNKFELTGIPRTENESLHQIIKNLADSLSISVADNEIKDIFRKKDSARGPGSIIVQLTTVDKRNKLLQLARGRKFTLEDVRVTGNTKGIFLNVPLLPELKRVLYQARQVQALQNWHRVWVYGAEIYVRIEEQGKPIKVNSLDELSILLQ